MDYVKLAGNAASLIKKYGKPAKIVRATAGGDAWAPTTTATELDVAVVESDFMAVKRALGTFVEVGDKVGLIAAADVVPTMADKIKIDDVQYSFVSVEPLKPGATTLLYQFVARK